MKNRLAAILLIALVPGCALPQSLKRVNAHAVRDTHLLLKESPESPVAMRAAKATLAASAYIGKPDHPVHPDQLDADIQALERDTSWLGWLLAAAPGWLLKAGKVVGYAATGAALLFGGNYLGGVRAIGKAVGVFTSAIEKHGNGALKKEITKQTMGTSLGVAIQKKVKKLNGSPSGSG